MMLMWSTNDKWDRDKWVTNGVGSCAGAFFWILKGAGMSDEKGMRKGGREKGEGENGPRD
jgi:hypothetical protein